MEGVMKFPALPNTRRVCSQRPRVDHRHAAAQRQRDLRPGPRHRPGFFLRSDPPLVGVVGRVGDWLEFFSNLRVGEKILGMQKIKKPSPDPSQPAELLQAIRTLRPCQATQRFRNSSIPLYVAMYENPYFSLVVYLDLDLTLDPIR